MYNEYDLKTTVFTRSYVLCDSSFDKCLSLPRLENNVWPSDGENYLLCRLRFPVSITVKNANTTIYEI